MSLLDIKNVNYSYDNNKTMVLKDVNFQFDKGKVYGIMGKSGAGKTTLLSLISGLNSYADGSILYKNKEIKDIDKEKLRSEKIGIIFQNYNLLLHLTAIENIILSMDIAKIKTKDKKIIAKKLLEKVNLSYEHGKRRVLKLSGGEQQRVAIARALSYEPSIIVADEPTGNLDPETEKQILEILKKLAHEDNKCVIIVTHSKNVKESCDVIYNL